MPAAIHHLHIPTVSRVLYIRVVPSALPPISIWPNYWEIRMTLDIVRIKPCTVTHRLPRKNSLYLASLVRYLPKSHALA